MNDAELPITGYLDRFSHRPGETFSAFVSVPGGGRYRARLVRVLSGDPNPAGPGVRFEDLSARFDQTFEGRRQVIHVGSYGLVKTGPVRDTKAACTWTVLVRPGVVDPGQVLIADGDVALSIGANGATGRVGLVEVATGEAMQAARWYRVWLSADPATGRVLVGQQRLGSAAVMGTAQAPGMALPSGGGVMFAAQNAAAPEHHFTGKLEDPAIISGFVEAWPDPRACR
jgi:N,N-dimethylformamidase